ncbi:MAG: exodeoxyribonuclease VII large subunit [Lewinella sp.]|nr:exodeoxyribonuclease VII large subunit [Lewinella sp.]
MTYSLRQLNEYLRRVVALNFPSALWLRAEIAAAQEKRGHHFVQLVEKSADSDEIMAQSEAVFWQRPAQRWARRNKTTVADLLQAGREVRLQVRVDFHERYGLKLQIEDIDLAFAVGQLALRRQQTISNLRERGALELNRQLTLPPALQRLAVISSPQAAGYHDFREQLLRNPYGYQFRVELYPAAMQGTQTSPEVRRQLRHLARRRYAYDAIVIIRGGGSRLDLSDFDDLALCEAAAQSPLPLIVGIGHETDQSVLDLVAHTSLKTPTAVAHFIVERSLQLEARCVQLGQRIQQLGQQQLARERQRLARVSLQLPQLAGQMLREQSRTLDHLRGLLPLLARQTLHLAWRELEKEQQSARLLSLDQTLARGFSLLVRDDDRIISRQEALSTNDQVTLHLQDRTRQARIED